MSVYLESMPDLVPTLRELKRLPPFKPLRLIQIRMIRALLATNMKVEPAARACGINWRNHYTWKEKPEYAQALEFAMEIMADLLESTMLDHAIIGRDTPIVHKGMVTGFIKEVNAAERIVLLKGLRAKYRESWSVNNVLGPTQVNIVHHHANAPAPARVEQVLEKIEDSGD